MVHQRSVEAKLRREQRKAAREYIIRYSFNDTLLHEQIDRTDPEDVMNYLCGLYGYCEASAVPASFKGVVLISDYGDGEFQRGEFQR